MYDNFVPVRQFLMIENLMNKNEYQALQYHIMLSKAFWMQTNPKHLSYQPCVEQAIISIFVLNRVATIKFQLLLHLQVQPKPIPK